MKKLIIIMVLVTVLCSNCCFAASKFADVNGTKYENAVSVLNSSGVIDGYNDGTFKPQNSVTRAELCKLLVSALNLTKTGSTAVVFSDVDQTMWFYDYVKAAVDNKVIIGYEDGTFRPNNDVTYAEMITMIIRAMKKESQIANRSDWPNAYISYASGYGLLSNVSYADPGFPAIRGEVSVALYNMVNRISAETQTQTQPVIKTVTTREYGFVTSVVTKNGVTTVKIEGNNYTVASRSSTFSEDTFAIFDKTDDEVKLVAYYGVNDLDGNADIVTYANGSAGDQDIKLNGRSGYADFSPKTFGSYAICFINVDVNSRNVIVVTKHSMKDSLNEVKIAKGDRIIEDTKNKALLIFRGLSSDDEFKNGKLVVPATTSSTTTSKVYYTVSYQWAPGAKVSGVSLPSTATVQKGSVYTVQTPKETSDFRFYATNYSGNIVVNKNVTITIDTESKYGEDDDDDDGGHAGSNMPLIDRVSESVLKQEIKSEWFDYIDSAYGEDVTDVRIKSIKLFIGDDKDSVKFEISYELHPASNAVINKLTIANGEIDNESGWVVNKYNVGVLEAYSNDSVFIIDYSSVGTGW